MKYSFTNSNNFNIEKKKAKTTNISTEIVMSWGPSNQLWCEMWSTAQRWTDQGNRWSIHQLSNRSNSTRQRLEFYQCSCPLFCEHQKNVMNVRQKKIVLWCAETTTCFNHMLDSLQEKKSEKFTRNVFFCWIDSNWIPKYDRIWFILF